MKKSILFCSFLSCLLLLKGSLLAQSPIITSFKPKIGLVSTLVTIEGDNLSNPLSIKIGGINAVPISNNGTSLVAMIMPGATSGDVSVTNVDGTVSGGNINVLTSYRPPNKQHGNKLFGIGSTPEQGSFTVGEGRSVAMDADGNTVIFGGPYNSANNNSTGAAWVFVRGTDGGWTQQGGLLTPNDAAAQFAYFGTAIAISADGNTAAIGAPGEYNSVGAVWIFTRQNGTWSQGISLTGTGSIGSSNQGSTVAISGDGNTVVMGGYLDNSQAGAIWVFKRNADNSWSQQGNKLVGSGSTIYPGQGTCVAITANGNMIVEGAPNDGYGVGAAWVFTRNADSVWGQQGDKIVNVDGIQDPRQGVSVSINADGTTFIMGGNNDSTNRGAAWVFTGKNGVWTQQGGKLVGTGSVGKKTWQGQSVSISADGNTALVGGGYDNNYMGASWIFTRDKNGQKSIDFFITVLGLRMIIK